MTTEIPPRRVRSAPIAYRSEGGIRIEYGDLENASGSHHDGLGGSLWLKYVDAFLLFQDLRTALKGVDLGNRDS